MGTHESDSIARLGDGSAISVLSGDGAFSFVACTGGVSAPVAGGAGAGRSSSAVVNSALSTEQVGSTNLSLGAICGSSGGCAGNVNAKTIGGIASFGDVGTVSVACHAFSCIASTRLIRCLGSFSNRAELSSWAFSVRSSRSGSA